MRHPRRHHNYCSLRACTRMWLRRLQQARRQHLAPTARCTICATCSRIRCCCCLSNRRMRRKANDQPLLQQQEQLRYPSRLSALQSPPLLLLHSSATPAPTSNPSFPACSPCCAPTPRRTYSTAACSVASHRAPGQPRATHSTPRWTRTIARRFSARCSTSQVGFRRNSRTLAYARCTVCARQKKLFVGARVLRKCSAPCLPLV